MLQTLLILLAIVAGVMLIRRRLGDSYASAIEADAFTVDDLWDHAEHPYHCVTCRCDVEGCSGVDPLKDKVFLVGDDHQLPVPECTATRCRCRYVHHPDRRRKEEDRRATFGLEQEMYRHTHGRERRLSPGRRSEDWSTGLETSVG